MSGPLSFLASNAHLALKSVEKIFLTRLFSDCNNLHVSDDLKRMLQKIAL